MPTEDRLSNVINTLKELESDATSPKNIKARIVTVIKILEGKEEMSIKVSKALHELESLADDTNMPSFIRTQLFNISSMLEVV